MRKKSVVCLELLFLFFPLWMHAQKSEFNVIKKPDWGMVLDKARKQKRIVFVDCGASWCGPCKKFASEVLTDKNVQKFLNKHFVSVYVDVEKDQLPTVNGLPWLGSVPTLLFVDAEKREVIHSHVGALDVKSFIQLLSDVEREKGTIRSFRSQMEKKPFEGRDLLRYMEELKKGGYHSEAKQYVPAYLATLTPDSLAYEGNWKLCEDELKDPMAPLFQQIWQERAQLYAWYGRERVMKKLLREIDYKLYYELNWTRKPEKFDSDGFEDFVAFLLSMEDDTKEYYRFSVEAELYARSDDYDNVLNTLKKAWDSSIVEDKKKALTQGFVRKMAYNVPHEQIQTCIDFIEDIVMDYGSDGTKGELLYLESELWKMKGDQQKAQEVERRGVKLINPNYVFN